MGRKGKSLEIFLQDLLASLSLGQSVQQFFTFNRPAARSGKNINQKIKKCQCALF